VSRRWKRWERRGNDGGNDGSDSSGVDLDLGQYDCDLTEPENPDLDYRPVIVDPEADVVVQAFEDFTCGHCATYKLEHFPTIREEYIDPGEVRYEHWDFPIPVNETWAVPVASAARGVGARQGAEAFFSFASTAYESQRELQRGGDRCRRGGRWRGSLRRHRRRAVLGLRGGVDERPERRRVDGPRGDADNLRERRGGRRLPGGDDRGGDRRGAVARLRRLVFRHSRASVF